MNDQPPVNEDTNGAFLEPTTCYAVAVIAALVIAGNVLLDAARGQADVLAASVRFLVAFAFVHLALRLVAGIAESYRGTRPEVAALPADEGAERPRRRSSDRPAGESVPPGP